MKLGLGSWLVTTATRCWVRWLYLQLELRVRRYKTDQGRLEQRYQLAGVSPEPYGDATRQRILELADATQGEGQFAWTSGTSREPKQIFYPPERVKRLQRTLVEQVLITYAYARLDRPAIYVLTGMSSGRSLSSLFAHKSFSPLVNRLFLSGSILVVPNAAELMQRYSETAVHVALWLLCKPTFLVTVNPSSLYVILEQVQSDWTRIRDELCIAFKEKEMVELRQRVAATYTDSGLALERLLNATTPPSPQELLPALRAVYCWDGGYVQPFIDNLKKQFAGQALEFLPMLSMSTETLAYQMYPHISRRGGLPIYPGNCFEFVQVDHEMTAENVLKPWELTEGKQYVMLVSDPYGLVRYNTEDVFVCCGMRRQTPLLHFEGRVGLRYSFTGEKITAEQLLDIYESVRYELGLDGAIFTCFPKSDPGGLPGYVFVYCTIDGNVLPGDLSADLLDSFLQQVNEEYAAKRISGRLAAPLLQVERFDRLALRIQNSNPRYRGSSLAQFKLLPLYKILWQELCPEVV